VNQKELNYYFLRKKSSRRWKLCIPLGRSLLVQAVYDDYLDKI